MRGVKRWLTLGLLGSCMATLPARPVGADETPQPGVDPGLQREIRLFPAPDLYRPYRADLHRPSFAIAQVRTGGRGIADSGTTRFDLRLGGRFGLLRVERPDRAWQLSIISGFDGQFDVDNSYDNIGWDGNYGLAFTTRHGPRLAFKLSLLHTSSHVGDEYAERTGRRRIGYTREELNAGVSWNLDEHWRVYGEGGWGYVLRAEDLQEPGRGQIGVEYEDPERLWGGRMGWFAALDVSATEERDWTVDTSLQAGLLMRSGAREWRLGLGYYDGRPPLGEFFQDDERYLTLGLWLDL